ncbi:hypothetical protein [Avibacterium paragallinarum]|uniref:hypothetical protein n=1 Tax=Avibacterium paragallinarum TaxID=728 RepID=UPI00397BCA85
MKILLSVLTAVILLSGCSVRPIQFGFVSIKEDINLNSKTLTLGKRISHTSQLGMKDKPLEKALADLAMKNKCFIGLNNAKYSRSSIFSTTITVTGQEVIDTSIKGCQ